MSGAVTDAIVGFHAQQAVEKALKAVLAVHGVEVPFTHDLAGLADRCAAEGATLPSTLAEIDRLTPFGVRLRYGEFDGLCKARQPLRNAAGWTSHKPPGPGGAAAGAGLRW